MRLNDLARQMRVDVSDLLATARDLGLDVGGPTSSLSHDEERALRKAATLPQQRPAVPNQPGAGPAFRTAPPRPLSHHGRWRGPLSEPSDLAKVFLRLEEAQTDARSISLPPRPARIRYAEASAREWAKHWFTAQEADKWITANGGISAAVAASLRDAGLTPEDATVRIRTPRGFVHKLPLAIRVSSGELTAAELREMKARA
ncbi:hypothetical protein ABZ570_03445 [Micromonospora sp. NPDC007271]|uniref:hypothetical protein n=1 Tax=Micromonospora sp. NPDC007271 TaxID=3154587 RepID=UPI0033E9B4E8